MERRRIGNVHVVALADNVQTYPGAAIYPEAGDALHRFAAHMDSKGGIALNFACFLLIEGDRMVLVDTGWGPEFKGMLMEELAAAGIGPEQIGAVAFTHLHGDHTGWNLDRATGRPVFPRARYLVPRADWEHYASQDPPSASFARDVRPLRETGQLELIEGERHLSRSVTTISTPGHTPGHTSMVVLSGGERGFILGDVVISPVDAEVPSLRTSFDWDHETARTTRERTIARLAGDGSLVGASHLPAPGFGKFVMRGEATRWAPA